MRERQPTRIYNTMPKKDKYIKGEERKKENKREALVFYFFFFWFVCVRWQE